jgi:sugar phosphate isomerase/epimerase
MNDRRRFLKSLLAASAGLGLFSGAFPKKQDKRNDGLFFDISLAEWSLHRALQSNKITNLDFPRIAREKFDLAAVEYVSTFFRNTKTQYLSELRNITVNEGINNVLIMVDGEGDLAESDPASRKQSVENHFKWIETAHYLGCQTIRVNARGRGSAEEVSRAAIDGLRMLSERAVRSGINVVVENHGGYSSNGRWLADVIRAVDMPNCGTLPDFGNFTIGEGETYDRYKGIRELMPYAKGVSAKTYDFDEAGNETTMDFKRILKIVQQAHYFGYIGIEYEGSRLSEEEGIRATKDLLIRTGKDLS